MTAFKEITVQVKSKLAIITLNRPDKKNAINSVMYEEVARALNELSENEATSITALTGNGEYYSSGTDLKITSSESFDDLITQTLKRFSSFTSAFINHKKLLIAVVNGPAIGIAVTTLGLCDVVYCTDTATFQTPFTRLGLCAEGCSSYTFPRIMGTAKAGEMLYLNYKLNAAEALKVGLVAQVYTKDELISKLWPQLLKYSEELPIQSLMCTKELMRQFNKKQLEEANSAECKRLQERWVSEDFLNAVMNFQKKSRL